ncbi:hypothetical protein SLEP1_g25739 [Rubroshorea leprosula]|uniref:Uncharacterized protein n=1 Tax=Rubroshorea leprosula TaxID=152421 RepID=A0AAV5JUB5_9ROSI|nr:hypothetical protein SLEP1_g25739 [Rubroshorea leprosula]
MKKLYRRGTVHPSPPGTADCLSFLPAAILTLAAGLSLEDKEVLAYLISCSNTDFPNFSTHRKNTPKNSTKSGGSGGGGGGGSGHDHPPLFCCDCFRCYTSYWVRWDSSPNRQLIHEIIDAYEDGLAQGKNKKGKKERRKKNGGDGSGELRRQELSLGKEEFGKLESVEDSSGSGGGGDGEVCLDNGEEGGDKGSVRKFVSFIGERIWGVWGQY